MADHTANLADTRYATLSDFLAAANLPARNAMNHPRITKCDVVGWAADWTGGAPTTAKALAAMTGQYEAGAAIIRRLETAMAKIKLPPKMDLRRRRVRADSGDDLDISAVYRGRLDIAWERTQRRATTASPMISIVVNTICSGAKEASVISFRGAVGIVLAQLLERFGYRVRIIFAMGGDMVGSKEKFSVRTVVKDYGKPVDRETIACATHPALFRVMGHRWMWAHANKKAEAGGATPKEALQEPNEIYISHEVSNERDAITRIQEIIQELTK